MDLFNIKKIHALKKDCERLKNYNDELNYEINRLNRVIEFYKKEEDDKSYEISSIRNTNNNIVNLLQKNLKFLLEDKYKNKYLNIFISDDKHRIFKCTDIQIQQNIIKFICKEYVVYNIKDNKYVETIYPLEGLETMIGYDTMNVESAFRDINIIKSTNYNLYLANTKK